MVTNNALYHQAGKLKYNNSKLQRAENRTFMTEGEINDAPGVCKRTRFHSRSSSTEKSQEAQCFTCRQPAGTDGVQEIATFQMDSKVRDWATILEDTELLGRLSAGDMVAQDAKYHKNFLSGEIHPAVFEEDVGAALTKACELDSDNDVVHLVRAAQTVLRHMFEESELFNGFPEG